MRPAFRILAACLAAAIAAPAFASPTTDALSECLVDHANGRDRKNLARWMIFAMAVHPETKSTFAITPEAKEAADRGAAQLFQRLMAVDCASELHAAFKTDGQVATQMAFARLGQVAVQELMADPSVKVAISDFTKYVDMDAVGKVLK